MYSGAVTTDQYCRRLYAKQTCPRLETGNKTTKCNVKRTCKNAIVYHTS